jgi:hypothetical protein
MHRNTPVASLKRRMLLRQNHPALLLLLLGLQLAAMLAR